MSGSDSFFRMSGISPSAASYKTSKSKDGSLFSTRHFLCFALSIKRQSLTQIECTSNANDSTYILGLMELPGDEGLSKEIFREHEGTFIKIKKNKTRNKYPQIIFSSSDESSTQIFSKYCPKC